MDPSNTGNPPVPCPPAGGGPSRGSTGTSMPGVEVSPPEGDTPRENEARAVEPALSAVSPPARKDTSESLDLKIIPLQLSEPAANASGCEIHIVAIYVCGNRVKNDDWEISPFAKDKNNDPKQQARRITQIRRAGPQVNGIIPQTNGSEESSLTTSWLGDPEMLPKFFPTARVTSFGLDINGGISSTTNAPIDVKSAANEIFKRLNQQWDEKQSIVFIAHGYGTNVVDHMLFFIEDALRLRVVESTAAIAMFAPPLENFDNLISWMLNEFNIPNSSSFFEARRATDDRAPKAIGDDFFQKTAELNIATVGYLESKPARSPNVQAQSLLERFDRGHSCNANVDNIARIDGTKDSRFVSFTEAIPDFVGTHQLLRAGKDSNKRAINELLMSSVNFKSENGRKQTVLHLAVRRGMGELVESLAFSGRVALDRRDEEGNTALHIATMSKPPTPEIVRHLLRAGANPAILNESAKSSQGMALEDGVDPSIRDLFKMRPLVEARIGQRTLIKGTPTNVHTQKACQEAGMVAREVFRPTDSKPERHRPIYRSVHDFIYTEDSIDDFFQATNDEQSESAICRWYHIPMNNMAWAHDMFAKLDLQRWPWPKPYKRGKFHHGRYMIPQATWLSDPRNFSYIPSEDSWAAFMPYISYERSNRQKAISDIIEGAGPKLPESQDCKAREDAEVLAIRGYLNGHNHNQNQHLAFHVRRTLDQSYYNMLKDTSYRDRTQVVARGAEHQWPESSEHNILMVDQLWLWFVKGKDGKLDTIISSFPSREGSAHPQSTSEADDLQGTVLDPTDRECIRKSTDLVSRILTVCCRAFDRHQHLESINFLYFFESAIGSAKEEETRLFARFQRLANTLHLLHEMHPAYPEYRSMLLKKLLDILEESKLLKEIKDILDELKMIKSVLKDQQKVVEHLQEIVTPTSQSKCSESSGKEFSNALMVIREAGESFDVMEAHAKQVEKGLGNLLDLKQKQANVWEARSSREGAEETAKQGKTILVFTVVTIIFLPLSFTASFFSLGVSIFPKKDGENNLSLSWVSAFLSLTRTYSVSRLNTVGVSFVVSIPLILLAFNIVRFSNAYTRALHSVNKHVAFFLLLLKRLDEKYRYRRHWLLSERVHAKFEEWIDKLITFIVQHDLPLRPDETMEAETEREMHGEQQQQQHVDDQDILETELNEKGLDKEEVDLNRQQKKKQENFLRWMKSPGEGVGEVCVGSEDNTVSHAVA